MGEFFSRILDRAKDQPWLVVVIFQLLLLYLPIMKIHGTLEKLVGLFAAEILTRKIHDERCPIKHRLPK